MEHLSFPLQKYKVGDSVRLHGGRGPRCDLHIYGAPQWGSWLAHPEWVYPYDYGLGNTSEGFALESSLRKIDIQNKTNTDSLFTSRTTRDLLNQHGETRVEELK